VRELCSESCSNLGAIVEYICKYAITIQGIKMKKLVYVTVLVFLGGCGGGDPTKSSSKVVVGPETCSTYFAEVVAACRDSIHEGLDLFCSTIYVGASTAGAQKNGNLFSSAEGKTPNPAIANSVCASGLRGLRKKRIAASVGEKKQWGPQCTEFFGLLDKKCFVPAVEGDFPNGCSTVLSGVKSIITNDKPENLCESLSSMVR